MTTRIEEIKAEFQMFVPEDDGSAMDWLENKLEEAHQAGIDEAVLDKEIDLTTAALMGMLTAGFPEELGNKHASLIAKSIMKNPTVEREALQDNK